MTTIPSDILLHLWLAFLVIAYVGCVEGIRRLLARGRIARGGRP
ncbi:hypothetical protein [Pseudomonas sp. B1(2018)]|nr:hypothetical protein [Pseudomonas sp. B1(2018)]